MTQKNSNVESRVRTLRRRLESRVLERKGFVSVLDEAHICSATRHARSFWAISEWLKELASESEGKLAERRIFLEHRRKALVRLRAVFGKLGIKQRKRG